MLDPRDGWYARPIPEAKVAEVPVAVLQEAVPDETGQLVTKIRRPIAYELMPDE
jgi:hypothetical protein